jgi:hypothetical protein
VTRYVIKQKGKKKQCVCTFSTKKHKFVRSKVSVKYPSIKTGSDKSQKWYRKSGKRKRPKTRRSERQRKGESDWFVLKVSFIKL